MLKVPYGVVKAIINHLRNNGKDNLLTLLYYENYRYNNVYVTVGVRGIWSDEIQKRHGQEQCIDGD